MQLPIRTLVKRRDDNTIYAVVETVEPTSGITLYKLVDVATSQRVMPNATIFELIVVDNRELYNEVLEYKIAFKKKLVTNLNKEIKEFKLIKSNLETYSSDEEELNEFINIFKSEKSKALSKLVKTKEHINFGRFLSEWVG